MLYSNSSEVLAVSNVLAPELRLCNVLLELASWDLNKELLVHFLFASLLTLNHLVVRHITLS